MRNHLKKMAYVSNLLLLLLLLLKTLKMDQIDQMDQINTALEAIKTLLPESYRSPQVLIICGSGLGAIGDEVESPHSIAYSKIPGFQESHVAGHRGELLFGEIHGVRVMCMLGRFHYYEGHSLVTNTLPVRVAALLGVQYMIVTNAAGGINSQFQIGDLMLINDHINLPGLSGIHPLRGANLINFGPRFLPLSDAYDLDLRVSLLKCASALNINTPIHEGTYFFVSGPTFETRAECLAIESLGGDAVGMSTVPEVIVARHCGIKVLGISLITNKAQKTKPMLASDVLNGIPVIDQKIGMPTHDEVLDIANKSAKNVQKLIVEFIKGLN